MEVICSTSGRKALNKCELSVADCKSNEKKNMFSIQSETQYQYFMHSYKFFLFQADLCSNLQGFFSASCDMRRKASLSLLIKSAVF